MYERVKHARMRCSLEIRCIGYTVSGVSNNNHHLDHVVDHKVTKRCNVICKRVVRGVMHAHTTGIDLLCIREDTTRNVVDVQVYTVRFALVMTTMYFPRRGLVRLRKVSKGANIGMHVLSTNIELM